MIFKVPEFMLRVRRDKSWWGGDAQRWGYRDAGEGNVCVQDSRCSCSRHKPLLHKREKKKRAGWTPRWVVLFGLPCSWSIFRDSTCIPVLTHVWWQLPGNTKSVQCLRGVFSVAPMQSGSVSQGHSQVQGCSHWFPTAKRAVRQSWRVQQAKRCTELPRGAQVFQARGSLAQCWSLWM